MAPPSQAPPPQLPPPPQGYYPVPPVMAPPPQPLPPPQGYYPVPPVVAPPPQPLPHTAVAPRREPGFLERCLAVLRCCFLLDECCSSALPSDDFVV